MNWKGCVLPKAHWRQRAIVLSQKLATIVTEEQIKKAIISGIEKNVRNMLQIPVPIVGVKGIQIHR